MDYKTLVEAVEGMSDEELYLAAKKIGEERRRRLVQAHSGNFQTVSEEGRSRVVMDAFPLVSAVRENLRLEMSLCSEATLASILDQVRDYDDDSDMEAIVNRLLQAAVTATLIHEARTEAKRRL
jgi:hypothetical protein